MTWIRTPIATRETPDGISRSSKLEATIRTNISEGVVIGRLGSVANISVFSTSDHGVATTASLDVSRAELRHIAKVATDLADLLDREA